MKSNSCIRRSLGVVGLGLLFTIENSHGQTLRQMSDSQLATFVNQLESTPQLSPTAAPKTGTFWSLAHPEWPPLPSNPGVPFWQVGTDTFILDDAGVSSGGSMRAMSMSTSFSSPPDFGSGGGDSPADSPWSPPDISNYAKFMAQAFSMIDTNDAVSYTHLTLPTIYSV